MTYIQTTQGNLCAFCLLPAGHTGAHQVQRPAELDLLNAVTARSITLTYERLCAWAGRELSIDEIDQIDMAIPHSSIPDAISTIADNLL